MRVLKSGHFRCKPMVPLWSWGRKRLAGTLSYHPWWSKTVVGRREVAARDRASHQLPPIRLSRCAAETHHIIVVWARGMGACCRPSTDMLNRGGALKRETRERRGKKGRQRKRVVRWERKGAMKERLAAPASRQKKWCPTPLSAIGERKEQEREGEVQRLLWIGTYMTSFFSFFLNQNAKISFVPFIKRVKNPFLPQITTGFHKRHPLIPIRNLLGPLGTPSQIENFYHL